MVEAFWKDDAKEVLLEDNKVAVFGFVCFRSCGCNFFLLLAKGPATKSDEFSKKFQTAFDPPPPHFRKLCRKFFMIDMVAYMRGGMMAR